MCCVSEKHRCACPREVRSQHKTSSAVVNGLPGAPPRVLYDKSHELRHWNSVAHVIYKYNPPCINKMRKEDVNWIGSFSDKVSTSTGNMSMFQSIFNSNPTKNLLASVQFISAHRTNYFNSEIIWKEHLHLCFASLNSVNWNWWIKW